MQYDEEVERWQLKTKTLTIQFVAHFEEFYYNDSIQWKNILITIGETSCKSQVLIVEINRISIWWKD